MASYKIGGDKK